MSQQYFKHIRTGGGIQIGHFKLSTLCTRALISYCPRTQLQFVSPLQVRQTTEMKLRRPLIRLAINTIPGRIYGETGRVFVPEHNRQSDERDILSLTV